MRTTSSFKTGGHSFQCNMWHPDKAMENLAWLTKMVGEPIVSLVVNMGSVKDLLDSDVDLALLTPAVRELFNKLDEKEFVIKMNEFTEGMLVDGKKLEYETHFMGRPGHLMKVVVNVLKAQYSDFFDEIPAAMLAGKNQEKTGTITNPAH